MALKYIALVPGSHPAFRRLQYEKRSASDEKLDESLGPSEASAEAGINFWEALIELW